MYGDDQKEKSEQEEPRFRQEKSSPEEAGERANRRAEERVRKLQEERSAGYFFDPAPSKHE